MTQHRPTINDVARSAKTSAATVSRYFSHPEKVSPKTSAKIEAAADALNYIRNRAAATTRGQHSNTIGMVVPTLESSIFAELIENVAEQLKAHRQTTLIATNRYDKANELEIVRNFAEHGIDGIILLGCEHDANTLSVLELRQIPTLCVWNHPLSNVGESETSLDTIGVDNVEIGRVAARQVINLGHRNIACIFGHSEQNDRAAGRQEGILQMMAESSLELLPQWRCKSSYDLRTAKIIATNLLSSTPRPSAVICGNDIIAFATIWAAQALGMRIPQDLSVMGIGDFQGAADMMPALSTIRIPARMIGKLAANRIMDMIQAPDTTPQRNLKVDFEVKMRQSTAMFSQP